MLFIIDAQLPPGLVDVLKAHKCEAQHVSRMGLGAAPDTVIWKKASDLGAMVMTKDEDFVALATRSKSGPGVVWIRIGNCTNQSLRTALAPVLDQIIAALANGERLIEVR